MWAIKDPRCSRLLPLWLELCRELAIPLRLLLAVRDPAEVVTSLVRRDGPLVGMDANRAQQLVVASQRGGDNVAQQADLPWAVVDFDRWFQIQSSNSRLWKRFCQSCVPRRSNDSRPWL